MTTFQIILIVLIYLFFYGCSIRGFLLYREYTLLKNEILDEPLAIKSDSLYKLIAIIASFVIALFVPFVIGWIVCSD